jgi:hypothetical protein
MRMSECPLRAVRYVNTGDKVYIIKDGRIVPCEVVIAAGSMARVQNSLHSISVWRHVNELYQRDEEP